jgi:hypothetical protein
MGWNPFGRARPPADPPREPEALTAAAQVVRKPESQYLQYTQNWQNEAWDFYDSCGEANYGITWLANMLSQVRLRAARMAPGLDEPEILSTGIPAEIIGALAGGVGGQSQIMRSLATQLSVPGDSYLVGEQAGVAENWTVRSVDEVRVQNRKYQVVADRTPTIEWRDLPPDSVPVRIWRPHMRWNSVADSPMRSALPILRELELVNRHITAQYLSRLASAGLLILPDEVEFPVREEFAEAEDPFVAEWIEIGAQAIANPGTASAVIPIPIRVPGEYVDKIKFLDFTLKIDEKIIEKRDSAINRLATKLDIPTEVLTGMGKVNHWTAWQLDEGSLKTHIAPLVETICYSLTTGYYQPRLKASGVEDAERYVVWYDMSELALRPDNSTNAMAAYDRFEISGEALRRETGFGEDDKPSDEELRVMALKSIIREAPASANAPEAVDALVGQDVLSTATAETGSPASTGTGGGTSPGDQSTAGPGGAADPGTPGTKDAPADTPPVRAGAYSLVQMKALHAVRFSVTRPAQLYHPPLCATHAYSCPFTHAALGRRLPNLSSGTYECRLDLFGQLIVGRPAPEIDTSDWIPTMGTPVARPKERIRA